MVHKSQTLNTMNVSEHCGDLTAASPPPLFEQDAMAAGTDSADESMDGGCSLRRPSATSASSSISSNYEGGESKLLKRSFTSFSFSSTPTTNSLDRHRGPSERKRTAAMIHAKSKHASMPTIGVKTRSAYLRDAALKRNENWEELDNDNINTSTNRTTNRIYRTGPSLLQVAAAAAAATSLQVTNSTNNDKESSDDLVGEASADDQDDAQNDAIVPTNMCISTTTDVGKVKDTTPSVTFDKSKDTTHIQDYSGDDYDTTTRWYSETDNELFLNDTKARASNVNQMMMYASKNESTYNSATGLTSPYVLKEYLASPQEIIGIEQLLYGQQGARENLKLHHRYALKSVVRHCQRHEQGHDDNSDSNDPSFAMAERLRERLQHTSNIACHMAQERATYVTLLDD